MPSILGGYPGAVVTDDMRGRALKETEEIANKLEVMRRRLELPQTADVLGMLHVMYDDRLARIVEDEDAKQHEREPLAISGANMNLTNFGGLGGELQPSMTQMPFPPTVAHRIPMPMLSTDKLGKPHKIKPGEIFEVTTRPQICAFRPEEIEINDEPSGWEILDIRVGNRSQTARQGVLPGKHFSRGGICSRLVLDTLLTAMDFTIVARYIGSAQEGLVFDATIVGSSAS